MTDMAATSTARRSAAEYARAGTHQLGSLGIGAFILLGLGSLGLYLRLQATAVGGNRWSAVPLAAGLLLYIRNSAGRRHSGSHTER